MTDPPDLPSTVVRWQRACFAAVTLLLATLAAAGLFELATRALVASGRIEAPTPPATTGDFWVGDHPTFGVWHRPNRSFVHETACFRQEYRTNSVGARDAERARSSSARRVVVLGDSFIEGWGVATAERMSDRLEAATGIEHLNFGMAHFSPYQSYLVYRDLASGFTHDAVLLGVLPVNDLLDLDSRMVQQAPSYEYRYRPYLVGGPSGFREVFLREPFLSGFLRRHSYGYDALSFTWHRLLRDDVLVEPAPKLSSGLVHSCFFEYDELQVGLLEEVLRRLTGLAHDKLVVVILIPAHRDLVRYHQSGNSPLALRLAGAGRRDGYRVIDLSPYLHDFTPSWDQYYLLPCDYHWSALGNAVAARAVQQELVSILYSP